MALRILPYTLLDFSLGFHPVSSRCPQARQTANHSWKVLLGRVHASAWAQLQQVFIEPVLSARLCSRCDSVTGNSRHKCERARVDRAQDFRGQRSGHTGNIRQEHPACTVLGRVQKALRGFCALAEPFLMKKERCFTSSLIESQAARFITFCIFLIVNEVKLSRLIGPRCCARCPRASGKVYHVENATKLFCQEGWSSSFPGILLPRPSVSP